MRRYYEGQNQMKIQLFGGYFDGRIEELKDGDEIPRSLSVSSSDLLYWYKLREDLSGADFTFAQDRDEFMRQTFNFGAPDDDSGEDWKK